MLLSAVLLQIIGSFLLSGFEVIPKKHEHAVFFGMASILNGGGLYPLLVSPFYGEDLLLSAKDKICKRVLL